MNTELRPAQITLGDKLAYGLGSCGPTAIQIYQVAFLLLFYTTVADLDPGLAGLALMLGRFWDAVTDPVMGNISDRTKSFLGRRRIYLVFGPIPLVLSFIALWTPPIGWSSGALFAYLLVADILFNTCMTVVGIPYSALGSELTTDYHERTRLMVFRMVFSMLGWYIGSAAIALNQRFLDMGNSAEGFVSAVLTFRQGYAVTAICIGVFTVICVWWTAYKVAENPKVRSAPTLNRVRAVVETFRNKGFLLLIGAFLAAALFEAMGHSFFAYLIRYWYFEGDIEAWQTSMPKLMLPILLMSFPAVLFWNWLSGRLGKKRALLIGLFCVSLVTFLNYFLIIPDQRWLIWVWLPVFGFVISATNLLVLAIVPDVVDEDELKTGSRRDGAFFGVYEFTRKLAASLGIGISGLMLSAIGFQEGVELQSETTIWWIRVVYAFFRAGGFLLAFAVLLWFPLTPARVAENRRLLDAAAGDEH